MTPRFVRNLTGAVALSGLALALACGGNDSAKPVIEVKYPPNTPVIVSHVPAPAVTLHEYTLEVSASDPKDKVLDFTAASNNPLSSVKLPYGQAATSATVYYIPGSAMEHEQITVTATNSWGLTASSHNMVQAIENRHPVLGFDHSNVAVITGHSVTVTGLPTVDPDGDAVSWAFDGGDFVTAGFGKVLLGGNGFVVDAAGVVPGDYTFQLKATESGNGLTTAVVSYHTVSVRVGDPLMPTKPTVEVVSGVPLTGHQVNLRARAVDPDGLPITYSYAVAGGGTLDVASNTTGLFTYRAPNAPGTAVTATVTVIATNSGGVPSTPEVYSLSIGQHAAPAALPVPLQGVVEVMRGKSVTVPLPTADIDGDTVTWQLDATGTSTWLTTGKGATAAGTLGTITFTAANDSPVTGANVTQRLQSYETNNYIYQGGANNITTTPATGSTLYTVNLRVVEQDMPVIVSVDPAPAPFFSGYSDHTHSLSVNATDPYGRTLATTASSSVAAHNPITVAGNVLTWDPTVVGPETITATVTDTTDPVRKATKAYGPITILQNTWPTAPTTVFQVTTGDVLNLTPSDGFLLSDAQGDTIAWAYRAGGDPQFTAANVTTTPTGISIDTAGVPARVSTYTVWLQLQESGNAISPGTPARTVGGQPGGPNLAIQVQVNALPNPVIADVTPQAAPYFQQITEHAHQLVVNASDPLGQPLTYSAVSSVAAHNPIAVAGNVLSWTPTVTGPETITVRVEDSKDSSRYATKDYGPITVTANAWPSNPHVLPLDVTVGDVLPVSLPQLDLNGDTVVWDFSADAAGKFTAANVTTTPTGVRLDTAGVPVGTYSVELKLRESANATDPDPLAWRLQDPMGGALTLTVNVNALADPIIASIVPQAAPYFQQITDHKHQLIVNASDPLSQPLTYSATSSLGNVVTAVNNVLEWTTAKAGAETITVKVEDSKDPSRFATDTYGPITVTDNTWPVVPYATDFIAYEGDVLDVSLPQLDFNNDNVTWAFDSETTGEFTAANVTTTPTGILVDTTGVTSAPGGGIDYRIALKLQESGNATSPDPLAWRTAGPPPGGKLEITVNVRDLQPPTIVSVTPVAPFDQKITDHVHKVIVTANDPLPGVLEYSAVSDINAFTVFTVNGNQLTWDAGETAKSGVSGVETVTVSVENKSTGKTATIDYVHTLADNTWPYLPNHTTGIALKTGSFMNVPAAAVDADGDSVAWDLAADPDGFLTDGGAFDFVSVPGYIKVDTDKMHPTTDKKYNVEFASTEFGNNLAYPLTHTEDPTALPGTYTVEITVEPRHYTDSDARITSAPPTGPAVMGGTLRMHFSAHNFSDAADEVVTWEFTDGAGAMSKGPVSPAFDIDITTIDKWDVWGEYTPITLNTDPDYIAPGFGVVLFGIRATFQSGAVAYYDYLLDLMQLADPEVKSGTTPYTISGATDIRHEVDTSGNPLLAGWTNRYAFNSELVLRDNTNADSLPLAAQADLSGAKITVEDPGMQYGISTVTFKLVDVELLSTGETLTAMIQPMLASNNLTQVTAGGLLVAPGPITFVSVPPVDAVTPIGNDPFLGDALLFTYEILDSTGTAVKDPGAFLGAGTTFQIQVDMRASQEIPQIDGDPARLVPIYPTPGDDDEIVAWVNPRPAEGLLSKWTIENTWSWQPGTVFDNEDDAVYMIVTDWPQVAPAGPSKDDGKGNPMGAIYLGAAPPTPAPLPSTNNWTLEWTPDDDARGQTYTITVQAWDAYGAASDPFDIEGEVWGSITGKSVEKRFVDDALNGGSIAAIPADFANGPQSIYATSFYPWGPDALGKYSKPAQYEVPAKLPDGTPNSDDGVWKAMPMYVGPYLIGAAQQDAKSNPTLEPVLGPLVHSTDFTAYGAAPNTNLLTYAYIDSDYPDLSTHAPYGVLGGVQDEYILNDQSLVYPTPLWSEWDPIGINFGAPSTWYANMFEVVPSDAPADALTQNDAIQMVIPALGQKGFFVPVAGWPMATGDEYPAEAYPIQFGYNSLLGWADTANYTDIADGLGTVNFVPFLAELNNSLLDGAGELAFETQNTDKAVLTVMKAATSTTANVTNLPYWYMERTGIPVVERELPNVTKANAQSTRFVDTFNIPGDTFRASLYRFNFAGGDRLGQAVSDAAAPANVSETLQVLAYDTTQAAFGPANTAGMPTLLEFGNLLGPAGIAAGLTANFAAPANAPNLGEFPIPYPGSIPGHAVQDLQWIGGGIVPVASYRINFESPNFGLPGSIGKIQGANASTIDNYMTMAAQFRITNRAWNGLATDTPWAAGDNIGRGAFAPTTTPVTAEYYANNIMYLTWVIPATWSVGAKPSGYIIEFFEDNGALDATSVPVFKVHVGADMSQFPIPEYWTSWFASSGNDCIIRFRTVQYGVDMGNPADPLHTLVDFNETPFLTALPMTWVDTILRPVDFYTNATPLPPIWSPTSPINLAATLSITDFTPEAAGAPGTGRILAVPVTGWAAGGGGTANDGNIGAMVAYTWFISNHADIPTFGAPNAVNPVNFQPGNPNGTGYNGGAITWLDLEIDDSAGATGVLNNAATRGNSLISIQSNGWTSSKTVNLTTSSYNHPYAPANPAETVTIPVVGFSTVDSTITDASSGLTCTWTLTGGTVAAANISSIVTNPDTSFTFVLDGTATTSGEDAEFTLTVNRDGVVNNTATAVFTVTFL